MDMDTDVVVVGAGPVGLLLGCELKLAGAHPLIVERLAAPDPTVKAGSVNVASARALDRRGLLPQLQAAQEQLLAQVREFIRQQGGGDGGGATRLPRFAAHFGGITIDGTRIDTDDPALADLGPAGEVLAVSQQAVEAMLAAWAAELGVEVRRGVTVTGFEQDEEGVTVRLAGGDELRTGWLVGADGGRSTVRKLAGFAFPGTDPEITGHQAMVDLEGGEKLGRGWQATDTGVFVNGPMPGRILTVQFDGPPADRDAPITAEELTAALRRVTGEDVTVTAVRSATRFTDNARLAEDYRRGRVLLAGDAAHVHSPFGGQGLNLGLGDAANLGWKLAAVVRGTAPDGLLDSYTAERRPVAAQVLDWTRAQVALMRPRPYERALRSVVADLLAGTDGSTHMARKLSGVLQRIGPADGHPLVGSAAPELFLADGSRLADHFHTGGGLLLRLSPQAPDVEGYADRVRTVTASCPGRPGTAALLVRPDGFVVWASDLADGTADGLSEALTTWFGAPAAA
ncbi:FAD-dependent monooxygenase [Kitasatospora sp. NPDC088346]|uniref:FAD-dependent monooxygenase n=1 Tax=Kitasatospora sp. NPDC088346 TaxID=3364073 RepID=UPI0037F7D3B7